MTRMLSLIAFVIGASIVVWMAASFMSSNLLALIVIAVIAGVYIIGFIELMRFQRDTTTLDKALAGTIDKITDLDAWLSGVVPSLRSAVRMRIQGEHTALPAPILTPYLVGLLVMLGLLGTFAGMVDTLKGAVSALEGTTELEAIRAGLTAPIKGLSLAFGTSVAGISASAMLGFISTLCRRQRLLASQVLDSKMTDAFKDFSLAFNRDQTYKAMQEQSESLPLVAQTLSTVAERLNSFSSEISRQLINNQEQFHKELSSTYQSLAHSVDTSLKQSVNDSNQLLAENLKLSVSALSPMISEMLNSAGQNMAKTQAQLAENLEQHFEKNAQAVNNLNKEAAANWQQGLQDYQESSDKLFERVSNTLDKHNDQLRLSSSTLLSGFEESNKQRIVDQQTLDQQTLFHWQNAFENSTQNVQQSLIAITTDNKNKSDSIMEKMSQLLNSTEQLVQNRIENEDKWLSQQQATTANLTTQLTDQLQSLRDDEMHRGTETINHMKALTSEVAIHLEKLGRGLEQPMTRLIETASETPRAAAEVIGQLRTEISNTIERDNQLLKEREEIFERLSTVATALENSSTEQQGSLQTLMTNSVETLSDIGIRFSEQVDKESSRLASAADHFSVSTVELASMTDAFSTAVDQFGQSNRDVSEMLNLIENSLQTSTQRSDEQMAYYVAQAREIIDHTMLSHQEVMEQMRQLGRESMNGEKG